jgi:hypothetical protein
LLEIYGVTDEAIRESLVQLAREARRRGWWTRYTDVLGSGNESMFIPGLPQTEDYARVVIRAGQTRPDPDTLNRRLGARMARKEILQRLYCHLVARALGPDESRIMIAGLADRLA